MLAVSPKITPRLPPPPPPMASNSTPTVSGCSGYLTKEEIVAGLNYAAGQEYLPFDPWCALNDDGYLEAFPAVCSSHIAVLAEALQQHCRGSGSCLRGFRTSLGSCMRLYGSHLAAIRAAASVIKSSILTCLTFCVPCERRWAVCRSMKGACVPCAAGM